MTSSVAGLIVSNVLPLELFSPLAVDEQLGLDVRDLDATLRRALVAVVIVRSPCDRTEPSLAGVDSVPVIPAAILLIDPLAAQGTGERQLFVLHGALITSRLQVPF